MGVNFMKFASQIYGAKIDESCLTVLDLYKRFKDDKGPLKVFKRRKDNYELVLS